MRPCRAEQRAEQSKGGDVKPGDINCFLPAVCRTHTRIAVILPVQLKRGSFFFVLEMHCEMILSCVAQLSGDDASCNDVSR